MSQVTKLLQSEAPRTWFKETLNVSAASIYTFTPVFVAESESAVNQRHHSMTLFPSVRFALTMQLFHGTERLNKDLTFEPQHSKGRNDNLQDCAFESLGHNDSLLSWQFECTATRTEMTGYCFICGWVSSIYEFICLC